MRNCQSFWFFFIVSWDICMWSKSVVANCLGVILLHSFRFNFEGNRCLTLTSECQFNDHAYSLVTSVTGSDVRFVQFPEQLLIDIYGSAKILVYINISWGKLRWVVCWTGIYSLFVKLYKANESFSCNLFFYFFLQTEISVFANQIQTMQYRQLLFVHVSFINNAHGTGVQYS